MPIILLFLQKMFVTKRSAGLISSIKAHVAPIIRFGKGIKMAKAEGGIMPSVRGPLTRLMRDSYIRYGDFVGEDERGNHAIRFV